MPNATISLYLNQHVVFKIPSRTQCKPSDTQYELAEYGSCWVHEGWAHVGHVDFMFVSFSFAWVANTNAFFCGI